MGVSEIEGLQGIRVYVCIYLYIEMCVDIDI